MSVVSREEDRPQTGVCSLVLVSCEISKAEVQTSQLPLLLKNHQCRHRILLEYPLRKLF